MQPIATIYSIWGFWALSWVIASAWSARTEARPAAGRSLRYYLLIVPGGVMLFELPPHAETLWPANAALGTMLVALTAAGFVFSWWARIHLGALWSGTVTKKEGHRVIDTGPYRLVRHPIYTGIILSSFATAAAKATPLAFAGAALMALGWYFKARLEEGFLREELGTDAYGAYAKRVPMLVPFAPV